MAEDKLTITELKKTISKQMSLPEEKASSFLAALVPAIMEGLRTDQQVRISGLGTFKLVRIAPRKSVNVNTGESIILDGYNKVTFVPESYIREQINEPFADLEAVRVDENGQPLDPQSTLPGIDPRARFDEQADEIKSILAELDTVAEPKREAKKEVKEPKEPEAPKAEEAAPAQKPKKSAKKPTTKKAEPVAPAESEQQPGRFRGWVVALITVLVLLIMLVAGYFVLVNKLESWANKLGAQQEEEEMLEAEEEAEMLEIEPLLPIDSVAVQADSLTVQEDTTYEPTILGIETVQAGSRLAQIARRYYGDPNKWTVIYEENKSVIKDPNNLQAGTKLRIPKLK